MNGKNLNSSQKGLSASGVIVVVIAGIMLFFGAAKSSSAATQTNKNAKTTIAVVETKSASPTPTTTQIATTTTTTKSKEAVSCNIKGNISYRTGERIYHVPGQRYYDSTKINTSAGERWFCSEAEAVAAGWRKSKV